MDAETQLQKLVTQMNAILAKLNAEQQRISDYLLQEEPPFWAFEDASRETVASFITDLEYRDDKAEGEAPLLCLLPFLCTKNSAGMSSWPTSFAPSWWSFCVRWINSTPMVACH